LIWCAGFNCVAMDGNSSSGGGVQNYRGCLQVALAALLTEAGFDSVDRMAIESLTEMATAIINEIGRSGKGYCELACRAQPMGADVVLALTEMGLVKGLDGRVTGAGLRGLREYAMRPGRKSLGTPGVASASKPSSMLHTGDRRRDGRGKGAGGVIPDYLPEFPDSHSYIRTPTHRQPEHDYESVREKAATQKRDVERALTRFMAKTCGRTHSLFNTDDTNLYPLISCDPRATRATANSMAQATQMFHGGGVAPAPDGGGGGGDGSGGADGVVPLPAYVTALMFRDQLFEEDESDYLPKKKTADEEEEEDDKDDKADVDSDDEDDKAAARDDKKGDFDSDDGEGDQPAKKKAKPSDTPASAAGAAATPAPAPKPAPATRDNPFLRTTRTPRNVLPGAQMPPHRRLL